MKCAVIQSMEVTFIFENQCPPAKILLDIVVIY